MASVLYLHVVICFIVLEVGGCAPMEDTKLAGAAAPGDIIIAGIFSIHEAVDQKNYIFSPHLPQCVR